MKEIVLSFLKELQQNNTREWFQANKDFYDAARTEFEGVINRLIPEIATFDESIKFVEAKDCLFRIYRDVRFSKNKDPYKTNFGAWITRGGRKSSGPGYYFHVSPEELFVSGGIYMPDPELMRRIRQEIYYNINEFVSILDSKEFRKHFSQIDDYDKMKKPPKDFPADFPDIDLLKHKSYAVWHTLIREELQKETLVEDVAVKFKAMRAFNAFLNRVF